MTKDSTHQPTSSDEPALSDRAAGPPSPRDHWSPATARSSRSARHLVDERLVVAIAAHDTSALAEAYSQHGHHVHALVRGLCGATRAEDLTKEIFLRLWNNPQHYDAARGSLRSHLLAQAHRRAVDILRSNASRPSSESTQSELPDAHLPGTEANALALLERAGISELVAALPVEERHPVVLAYFGGHTYRDVARLLAVPEDAIKSRIRSGLQRLTRSDTVY